ncbi:shikimate dehydrogenase [Brevibacterium sandarakinum]|uniref:Shikimate dehydrogenase n=2 Tax=Actinomycetes TaxID=1760 RepID=A0A1H1X536_BRESA|nr:shikimate dehydrogenase [Brevibacterium sandarakinum]
MAPSPTGASRLYPIIGDPIKYVESPVWLTKTFADRGHDGICVPMQVPDDALDPVMAGLTATGNIDGILVTMPHKHTAFAHCATSSDRARLLEVVSVIRRSPDGSWHGDMLDGLAFVKAQQDRGATIDGARALLVGAGGAGSAIAVALLEAGVKELVVHDKDEDRASGLIEVLDGFGTGQATAGPGDPTGFDLVFNATPLGMADSDPLPIDPSLLDASMFVGDVIAGHGTTPFIQAARDTGCRTATGSDMVEAVQALMADFMLDQN